MKFTERGATRRILQYVDWNKVGWVRKVVR
jgi:hypothetical protein